MPPRNSENPSRGALAMRKHRAKFKTYEPCDRCSERKPRLAVRVGSRERLFLCLDCRKQFLGLVRDFMVGGTQ